MKVLQIVKTNVGANWAFEQAKWLNDSGVEVITVLPSIDGRVSEKYKLNDMKVVKGDFTLPIKKPWELISKVNDIKNLVDEINPDIIHCHFVTNIMMLRLALRKSKIPRLFQVPGPLHLESNFFRKAEIMLSNENDFWAGACKKTCDIYGMSGIENKRIFLAYYGGYGGETCQEYSATSSKLHEEYGISSDKILVGMVSYFYSPKKHLFQTRGLKGHEDFIDAIALVREKNPSVIGIIIGDAWGNSRKYVENVKKYAWKKCKDSIIFTGFRTDMKEIYKELNIAVHPSHSENLGGAAESLAAGVPTISTNVGGFPDIVIHNETGYTVEKKNPDDLADAMIKMIDDEEKATKMGEKGQQLVRDLLDVECTGKEIKCIYEKILKEGQ